MREANLRDRLLLLLRLRKAFLVKGDSMLPTLKDGDAVAIDPKAKISEGDIVLARHPYKQSVKILKRVQKIDADGRLSLIGDNPAESTDSRTFGTVSLEYVYGKAVCRLRK